MISHGFQKNGSQVGRAPDEAVRPAVHDDSIDGTDRPHDLVADWIVDTEDASLAGALVVYEPDPGYPHVTGAMER